MKSIYAKVYMNSPVDKPGEAYVLSEDEMGEVVEILRNIIIYRQIEPGEGMYSSSSLPPAFGVVKSDFSQITIEMPVGGPVIKIDGVSYTVKPETAERLEEYFENLRGSV